jgi:hypothetical protein
LYACVLFWGFGLISVDKQKAKDTKFKKLPLWNKQKAKDTKLYQWINRKLKIQNLKSYLYGIN